MTSNSKEIGAGDVIGRIVERNNALWALLTDHTLTREQQLECIEKAFGPSPSSNGDPNDQQ